MGSDDEAFSSDDYSETSDEYRMISGAVASYRIGRFQRKIGRLSVDSWIPSIDYR